MTWGTARLAQRRASLLRRCALQRARIRDTVAPLQSRAARIDRAVHRVHEFLSLPAIIAIGTTVVLALGRSRALRLLGGALTLLATVRRVQRHGETLAQVLRR